LSCISPIIEETFQRSVRNDMYVDVYTRNIADGDDVAYAFKKLSYSVYYLKARVCVSVRDVNFYKVSKSNGRLL